LAITTDASRLLLINLARDFNKTSRPITFPETPRRKDYLAFEIGAGMYYAWEVRSGSYGVSAIDSMLRVQTGDADNNRSVAEWIMKKLIAAGLPDGLSNRPRRLESKREATKYDIHFSLDQCDGRSRSDLIDIPVRQMGLLVDCSFQFMAERIQMTEAW
jgi:hypothetical protein